MNYSLSLGALASYLAEMTLWTAFLWLILHSQGEGHISSMSAAVGRPNCGEGVVNICISCQRLYISLKRRVQTSSHEKRVRHTLQRSSYAGRARSYRSVVWYDYMGGNP